MLVLPLLALCTSAVSALSVPQPHQAALNEQQTATSGLYLVELTPGETRWITEDQKWELKRVSY